MFSPLEQFEVTVLSPGLVYWLPIWFVTTNTTAYMFALCDIFLLLLILAYLEPKVVARRWQAIFEFFYVFILDMVKAQAGLSAYVFFPLFVLVFTFILLANLIGLIPFSFTLTAQLIIPFFLALSFNLGFIFFGILFT
jgi:F-type H+-transporting ATPase subunit a